MSLMPAQTRRRMAAIILATCLILPATHVPPASGAAADLVSDWLPPAGAAEVARVTGLVAQARRSLGSGSLRQQLSSLLRIDPARRGADLPEGLSGLAAQPASVGATISSLASAVRRASDSIGTISLPTFGKLMERGHRFRGLVEASVETAPVAVAGPFAGTEALPTPSLPRDRSEVVLPGWLARREARAVEAASLLASAIDGALPSLSRAAKVAAPSGATVGGCDILDELPEVCIGGPGDNVYSRSGELTIDLGGNDTYRTTAGGAPFAVPGETELRQVSVNIDLGGSDIYLPPPGPVAPANGDYPEVAQIWTAIGSGAGVAGAVGISVDLSGGGPSEDRYLTVGRDESEINSDGAVSASTTTQGAGSFGGVGLLLDQGGADTYSATQPQLGRDVVGQVPVKVNLQAQGLGAIAYGSLVDIGSGADDYIMRGAEPLKGDVMLYGQGAGAVGAGALYDDGGQDVFDAGFDLVGAPGPNVHDRFGTGTVTGGISVRAQGHGTLGTGMLLTGIGDTSYRSSFSGRGLASRWIGGNVQSQGFGGLGVGVIDDLGGNDEYSASARLVHDPHLVVADACETNDPLCFKGNAEAVVSGWPCAQPCASSPSQLLEAQGAGTGGLLRDHSGNDEYHAVNEMELLPRITDKRTDPASPARMLVEAFIAPVLLAQGATNFEGTSVLIDDGGTDSYRAETVRRTVAEAGPSKLPPRILVTDYSGAGEYTIAQGAAGLLIQGPTTAALLDLGGTGDMFSATVRNVASAPDPSAVFRDVRFWPVMQGAGLGGTFVALGQSPVVISEPPRPGCSPSQPDYRGSGSWTSCRPFGGSVPARQPADTQDLAASGTVPAAEPRASVDIAFGDTPSAMPAVNSGYNASDPRLDAEVVMTDAAGSPLPDQAVTLTIQFACSFRGIAVSCDTSGTDGVDRGWFPLFEETVVTDADGVARALLPIAASADLVALQTEAVQFRVLASYGGSHQYRPAHAAHPFAIEE